MSIGSYTRATNELVMVTKPELLLEALKRNITAFGVTGTKKGATVAQLATF